MTELAAPPAASPGFPDFNTDGRDWPHRETSSFHRVCGTIWHVQRMGRGPVALLLHGTGAATHSWAGLMPALATHFDCLAIDLPGHGFTQVSRYFRIGLAEISALIGDLLADLDMSPALIIGHSAGAAIMIDMTARGVVDPGHLVSLNGALKPFPGLAGTLAAGAAKVLTVGGFAARGLARSARDRARVERLLTQTGSVPPDNMIDAYACLLKCQGHVAGTLAMMANWNLAGMPTACAALRQPVLFVAGENDTAVPPREAGAMARLAPHGAHHLLGGLGHLAHEEAPERIADLIFDFTGQAPA